MGYKPMHTTGESILTPSSVPVSGFYHLALILLSMFVLRMTLESIIENGILMTFGMGVNPFEMPLLYLLLALNLFIVAALLTEKLASKNFIGYDVAKRLTIINLVVLLIVPIIVIYTLKLNPVGSFMVVGLYIINMLKLWSYGAVNRALRGESNEDAIVKVQPMPRRRSRRLMGLEPEIFKPQAPKPPAPKPTLQNLYYFIFSPTLCYDINFRRTERVRKGYLCRLAIELVVLTQVWVFMLQQWTAPAIVSAAVPIMEKKLDILGTAAAFLKFALVHNLSWLLFSHIYFHLQLNILAEILRFADRQFYGDWWNSSDTEEFWRKWNILVHKWCVRHIYQPALRQGYSKLQSVFLVFFVSAIFHEYLASVPLKIFSVWAFGGLMTQIPLILLTKKFGGQTGNILVWLSLILGQPIGLIAYYIDCQYNC